MLISSIESILHGSIPNFLSNALSNCYEEELGITITDSLHPIDFLIDFSIDFPIVRTRPGLG